MGGDLPPDDAVRVVIVDDHELFRRGLAELLAERGIEVVGEAGDGRAAARAISETAPDVVLMDVAMPGLSGVEVARELSRTAPATRIVLLTVSADDDVITEAVLAGSSP